MTLEDNRPGVLARIHYAPGSIPAAVAAHLLLDAAVTNPDLEVSSVHFSIGKDELGLFAEMSGRCGELAPEPTDAAHDAAVAAALAGTRLAGPCPSCHQLPGRPPTEYCQHPENHYPPASSSAPADTLAP